MGSKLVKHFQKTNGGVEWLKIIIPILFLWGAWITYSSYEVRHLLHIEQRLDQKFEKAKGILHMRVTKDATEMEDDISDLRHLMMQIWSLQVEGYCEETIKESSNNW